MVFRLVKTQPERTEVIKTGEGKNKNKKEQEKQCQTIKNISESLLFCSGIICQVWKPSAGQDCTQVTLLEFRKILFKEKGEIFSPHVQLDLSLKFPLKI